MGKRPRLPKDSPEREVAVLFPNVEIDLPKADLDYYAHLPPFAFAIDRQSIPKAAKDADATGMRRRVEAIKQQAAIHTLHLPEPPPRNPPVAGELPYLLDGEEVRRHWFVDGIRTCATGYAANQNARPRLWDAFLTCQALAKRGCAPAAFVVGEGTRMFRDPTWLTLFLRALWRSNVRFYDGLFGEVTEQNLQGYCAYITALSGWLPTVMKGARAARAAQGRIFHGTPPWGLTFIKDKAQVYADPKVWPTIVELVERLADGRLPSMVAAAEWMHERGTPRSRVWVRRLIHGPMLEGRYVCYDEKFTARTLKQREGLFTDLDITPKGNRRWFKEPCEGQEWPVEHALGTSPIPMATLRAARARVLNARGRPTAEAPPPGRLIDPSLLRCATCGHSVVERRAHLKSGREGPWALMCRAVQVIRSGKTLPLAAARKQVEPHVRYWRGAISPTLWDTLRHGLQAAPLEPGEPAVNLEAELARLHADLDRTRLEFERFQDHVLAGRAGDLSDEQVVAYVEKKRAEHTSRIRDLQAAAETFASKRLTDQRLNASVREASLALRWALSGDLSEEDKRRIVREIVERVDINLETGEFVVHVNTTLPELQKLTGVLGRRPPECENEQTSRTPNIFFTLVGTLAGSVRRP